MQLKDNQIEERMNLLSFLSRKLGYTTLICPAPPRECLQMFGGNMSVEEFRTHHGQNKLININIPPMVVMVSQLEEVNDMDVCGKMRYVPLDHDRVDKYKAKIRLRRALPVNANKNTLENVMHFSVKP